MEATLTSFYLSDLLETMGIWTIWFRTDSSNGSALGFGMVG